MVNGFHNFVIGESLYGRLRGCCRTEHTGNEFLQKHFISLAPGVIEDR